MDQLFWIENGEKALTSKTRESTICWDTQDWKIIFKVNEYFLPVYTCANNLSGYIFQNQFKIWSLTALEELKNSHSILFENGDLENQINTDRLSFEDQKEDEPFMDENKFDFMINSDRDHNTKDEYKEA